MSKGLTSFIGIIILILFSTGTAIIGIGKMILSLINSQSIMPGLELFFLGSISFTVTLIAYTALKILSNTQIIAETLSQALEKKETQHPLANLFNNFGDGHFGRGFPMEGTVRISRLDNDGTIHHMGEKDFNSHEEFLQYRDELINKVKSNVKTIKEMSIEELDNERIAAEDRQDYNAAAAFRDAIEEKKKAKS